RYWISRRICRSISCSARRESFHPHRRCVMMREGVESETYFQWLNQAVPDVQLHHLMSGYWISAAIGVAAELNLADLMTEGARASTDLARMTGTHPAALYRLLRTLASVGLFTEVAPGHF